MTTENKLTWLHLSDIHMGCRGSEEWAHVTESLRTSVKKRGMPDLIFITGDIAWKGRVDQYERFDAFLKSLLGWLRGAGGGPDPLILPVPGNHDLERPEGREAFQYRVLENFSRGRDDPDIKWLMDTIWETPPGDASFFTPLFANYQSWFRSSILPRLNRPGVEVHQSHFPGDWSVRIALPDRPPLRVVGLNAAWRHFADLKPGQLELFPQQLLHALAAKPDHDTLASLADGQNLLLMHHPPKWFSPGSWGHFYERVYPTGRFLACLHGHMHEPHSEMVAVAGGVARHYFQAPSLFGLKEYGTAKESRAFGYAWGSLDPAGEIRVWPMEYRRAKDESGRFVFDDGFHGDAKTGVLLRPGQGSGPAPKKKTVVDGEALEKYRHVALAKHGSVALIGVGGADLTLDLAKVYVPLLIVRQASAAALGFAKGRRGRALDEAGEGEVILTDLFRTGPGRHVLLLGAPGAGKSTVLRKLLHHCLTDGPEVLGLAADVVPLFLRLRRFRAEFLKKPLADYPESELATIAEGEEGLPPGLGERLWRRGRLLLLLDGLDEIADPGFRAKVARHLEKSLAGVRSRDIQAVISCRFAGYGEVPRLGRSFSHLEVRPLDDSQVTDFVGLWFQEAHLCLPKGNAGQAERDADKLIRNLGEERYANRQIKIMVGNPLLLTLLCVVVLQKHEIPRRRVEFYRECLEVLLYRWRYLQDEEQPPLSLELALAVLERTAWEMHDAGRQYDLKEVEFVDLAEQVLEEQGGLPPGLDGFRILRWLHVTCGVLTAYADKEYGLMHLGFQEYLAARYIASERQSLVEELATKGTEKWWREVFLLLAGLEDRDLFTHLAEVLLPRVLEPNMAGLLREMLLEAPVVDLQPFLARLQVDNGDEGTQMGVLWLLSGRADAAVRKAATILSKESPNPGVKALADRFLEQPEKAAGEKAEYDLLLVFSSQEREEAKNLRKKLRRAGRWCVHLT